VGSIARDIYGGGRGGNRQALRIDHLKKLVAACVEPGVVAHYVADVATASNASPICNNPAARLAGER
jgi:hypothetical protein